MSLKPVDLHTHGIGRFDTRTNDPAVIMKMAELHGRRGTASILPTIYPGPREAMRSQMEAVKRAIAMQESGRGMKGAARILGLHLEGPFLNPAFCGALDSRALRKPSLKELKSLVAGFEDIIRIIVIAPELPGALPLIQWCSERGINVNMGHSNATYEEALAGKKAGARGICHLFNAMRPFHHREPGITGLGLLDPEIYVEVIADGVHIREKALELVFSVKRLDKIIVVSDTVAGTSRRGAVYAKGKVIAGSAVPLAETVSVLKSVGVPDAEIEEAMSDNPLRFIGLR